MPCLWKDLEALDPGMKKVRELNDVLKLCVEALASFCLNTEMALNDRENWTDLYAVSFWTPEADPASFWVVNPFWVIRRNHLKELFVPLVNPLDRFVHPN